MADADAGHGLSADRRTDAAAGFRESDWGPQALTGFPESRPEIPHPSICYPHHRRAPMAKGVNKVFLLGNVGKDPEIRTTAGGMTVASFSLATADRAKDQQGNWADKTEWHNLVCFQRTAEIVRDYVKKGSQIFAEGKIQTRSWDDKTS